MSSSVRIRAKTLAAMVVVSIGGVVVSCSPEGPTDGAPDAVVDNAGYDLGFPDTVLTDSGSDACLGACGGDVVKPPPDSGDACTGSGCGGDPGCADPQQCGPCEGIDCLPCAHGQACAGAGPFIGQTCCAEGDSVAYLGSGKGSEVVDLESDGKWAILCGGFGADASDVTDPSKPEFAGHAAQRCQRIAFGADLPGGGKVVYLAHHGDSWVANPFLGTFVIGPGSGFTQVDSMTEPGVLYEGMAFRDGHLYVAAHGGGLRVYETKADGTPSHVATMGGLKNAWKVALDGDHAYVADFDEGLAVVSIADPAKPSLAGIVPLEGNARDVVVQAGRIYVALGGDGVDVLDATDPASPVNVGHIDTPGSVQAVAAEGGLLALASWTHVAIHDTATLALVGTEQVRKYPDFDQILGVAFAGGIVYAGEWEGLHVLEPRPGYVAPDLWIEDELLMFPGDVKSARAVIVENRGLLDLVVSDIQALGGAGFTVDRTTMTVAPGEADVVEVTYTPPGGGPGGKVESAIRFFTNDPDPYQSPFALGVVAGDSGKLDVGDQLTSSFGFLDPNGAGQVDGLKGHVTILAYFALF